MPETDSKKTSSNTSVLKVVAGVAIGAAVALGAYFMGREEGQTEAKQQYQERVSYAQNMTPKVSTKCDDDDDEDDDKITKDCIICRVSFKQLMNQGVELHSTPCGHVFCKNCIDDSIRLYSKCPACNEGIAPGETHRIYL